MGNFYKNGKVDNTSTNYSKILDFINDQNILVYFDIFEGVVKHLEEFNLGAIFKYIKKLKLFKNIENYIIILLSEFNIF